MKRILGFEIGAGEIHQRGEATYTYMQGKDPVRIVRLNRAILITG